MPSLHIDRSGRPLAGADRRRLERAKNELRKVFGRPARSSKAA
jgi:hypothetical protein